MRSAWGQARWLLATVVLCGCAAPGAQLASTEKDAPESQENREAKRAISRLRPDATAKDVALTDAEREKFFRRVERDTLEEDETTMLLIHIAHRNPDEKHRLMERVPTWFRSSNLATRCMAFNIVRFLKVGGYEAQSAALLADLASRSNPAQSKRFRLDDLQNREAKWAMSRIRSNSTAKDVALVDAEREKFFRRVERDTLEEDGTTMLLICTAYRNPDEKRRLIQRVPAWFRSSNLSTRYMAFNVVKFLKVRGYEAESSALLSDMAGRSDLTPGERFLVEDLRAYLQEAA